MSADKVEEESGMTVVKEEIQLECRACLQVLEEQSGFVNIFECWTPPWDGMLDTIAENLSKLTNVQISELDQHSKFICSECCYHLRSACIFITTVCQTDQILKQRSESSPLNVNISSDNIWPKPIQLDKNIDCAVFGKPMDVEIKQEVVSDEECSGQNGIEEDYRIPHCDIKVEPEEIQAQPRQIIVNGNSTPDPWKCALLHSNSNSQDSQEYFGLTVKEEPPSEEETESIPLDCMLCAKTFNKVTGLKAHVIAQHSYKTVKRRTDETDSPRRTQNYVCATCRRCFATSTDLMVHETCHNKSVCYGCHKQFDTFALLTKHRHLCKPVVQATKLKTLHDVQRPTPQVTMNGKYKCSQCDDVFSDDYYLKIHQEVHHTVTNGPLNADMATETLEDFSE